MVDSADEPPLSRRLHSWAKTKVSPPTPAAAPSLNLPRNLREDPVQSPDSRPNETDTRLHHAGHDPSAAGPASSDHRIAEADKEQQDLPSVDKKGDGTQSSPIGTTEPKDKPPLVHRFLRDVERIIFSSWVNWLLVFVPVGLILGILVDWVHTDVVSPSAVFALNAIAIIPLASLLSFATESVAIRLGDTIGALLNVTFGNAVELIIFIIALAAKEVRVVQAAALGSILANLLLILGMCFVAGGLRFREQLYNSTVSQMSACLLCLSVISLLLPTAFHASFSDTSKADHVVLKVSRGTSVVLLLVYMLYLLFQLKSHAFMYQSTPQHLIDEESHPGVLADILNSSSSSSDTSASGSTDSDSSSGSHTTAKRIRRALRRRRRKSTSSTKDTVSIPGFTRSPSVLTRHGGSITQATSPTSLDLDPVFSGDEADVDGEGRTGRRRSRTQVIQSRDFESEVPQDQTSEKSKKRRKNFKKTKRSKNEKAKAKDPEKSPIVETQTKVNSLTPVNTVLPQVEFAAETQEIPADGTPKRPFNIRHLSEAVKPAFPHHQATGRPLAMPIRSVSRPRSGSRGLRRTSSMPDMIHPTISHPRLSSVTIAPVQPRSPNSEGGTEVETEEVVEVKEHLSRTSAVILLLATTGLVALCAEFLVGSINYLVANSSISQAFIGLIILPIVGNAAEHVTAVTVAAKNKMDLAINIALGSSIQIALFVTPLMVILGWILKTDMSLYFSLFETVSLFASAFIVSFLMIDGRSNYLEGALLIAAYVIIAVAAFFYPTCDLSSASGPLEGTDKVC
ncbi:calcium/proton exchanger [Rhinocladiella mackenziei CBS 650.93]|uniref:Rhinocladiella mackenziei CBS 650.93 unplaced genomic scaffold supercont1.2, whole genome shotgun sequence n=1 Tax=Rhinocladiella mackenziei CBS 650.93 TaxID=1442369 RepID=A0A0D2FZR2_9EURO|nr:calcium/proton exchanger [Rhinocladiella mackenziei CBS 650.93]KIX07802.1 calcium/proton exchanger [Rhinocladiella mackenziei CBS 650.93]